MTLEQLIATKPLDRKAAVKWLDGNMAALQSTYDGEILPFLTACFRARLDNETIAEKTGRTVEEIAAWMLIPEVRDEWREATRTFIGSNPFEMIRKAHADLRKEVNV